MKFVLLILLFKNSVNFMKIFYPLHYLLLHLLHFGCLLLKCCHPFFISALLENCVGLADFSYCCHHFIIKIFKLIFALIIFHSYLFTLIVIVMPIFIIISCFIIINLCYLSHPLY